MYCHICENGGVGVCRHCFKFYCPDHGDQFCSECQTKGWSRKPQPAQPLQEGEGCVDYRMVERLTDMTKFAGVIPTASATTVNAVLIIVGGIELYETAFRITASIRFSTEVSNTVNAYFPRPEGLTITDDVATLYTAIQQGGYFGMDDAQQTWVVTPLPDATAKSLIVNLPRFALSERGRRGLDRNNEIQLDGPWTLTLDLSQRPPARG